MKDIIFQGDRSYRVNYHITTGGTGYILHGTPEDDPTTEVCIKVTEPREALEDEFKFLDKLRGVPGFPKHHWTGRINDCNVMIQDLLGPSLEVLLTYCGEGFSEKTILLIAEKAIDLLEAIHSRGIVHRDIKPDNFVMGTGKNGNQLYLIDFGLAKHFQYDEPPPGRKVTRAYGRKMRKGRERETERTGGTLFSGPIALHQHLEQSPIDDLESLLYMLRYLVDGTLPWYDRGNEGRLNSRLIYDAKKSTNVHKLFNNLPGEFEYRALRQAYAEFEEVIFSTHWQEVPDYRSLRSIVTRALRSGGHKRDNVYCWTQRRFDEMWKEIRAEERQALSGRE